VKKEKVMKKFTYKKGISKARACRHQPALSVAYSPLTSLLERQ
jgi:hypothetical protein